MGTNKFVIAPHMRLHEWVAEEKGYFEAEGLDYEFADSLKSKDGKIHDLGNKVGAFQTFEEGRTCNVSSACHWTINVAAASGHGKLYRDAYSVAPAGIFVAADSLITSPAELANVPISVGYQSGSHYSTNQVLEQWLKPEEISLSFSEGLLFKRLQMLVDGEIPAQRAQRDIDLRPELYTHYFLKELPARFHDRVDTGRMGSGERIVFEPYTREVFDESREWVAAHDIFPDGNLGSGDYGQATVGTVT